MEITQILFSDIDGTFADHAMDYSHGKESLKQLITYGILPILISSKPEQAIRNILKDCDTQLPYIFENGGGIIFPETPLWSSLTNRITIGEVKGYLLGEKLAEVINDVKTVLTKNPHIKLFFPDEPKEFDFEIYKRYFPEWTKDQIWEGVRYPKYSDLAFAFDLNSPQPTTDEEAMMIKDLEQIRLQVHKGGLFYHVTRSCDKGAAVKFAIEKIKSCGLKINKTFAIGDSANDLSMLKAVDEGYLVQKSDRSFAVKDSRIIPINKPSTKGFIELVSRLTVD